MAVAAAGCIVYPERVNAQGSRRTDPSAAELAIATGRLDLAEDALYAAVRRDPQAPAARGALGAFLASRGRFLAGATLLDEALQFGADTAAVEARQFEVYRWAGEYARIADLHTLRISTAAREAYSRAGRAVVSGAMSSTVDLRPNTALGLGRIELAVGGVTVAADVDPLASGLYLPSSLPLFSAIDATGASADTTFGVVRSATIGGVAMASLPVALVPDIAVGRIGLDVLALVVPTFDRDGRKLTVHGGPYAPPGRSLPVLLGFPGVSFVAADGAGPVGLHTPGGQAALRGARWTLDVARGAMVIEP